jgi:hypothetical protein
MSTAAFPDLITATTKCNAWMTINFNKKKNLLVLRLKTQIMNLQTKSEIHQQER